MEGTPICILAVVVLNACHVLCSTGNLLPRFLTQNLNHVNNLNHGCNVNDKELALAMIQQWTIYNRYDAVKELYFQLTYNSLPQSIKRSKDPYQQAFNNGEPNVHNVFSFIKHHFSGTCKDQIIAEIEVMWMKHLQTTTTTAPITVTTAEESTTHVHTFTSASSCQNELGKNNAIGLLTDWDNRNHYDAIEQLYLELALGLPQPGQPDKVSNYQLTKNYMLRLDDICRQEVFRWMEKLAKTHTPTQSST